MIAKLASNGRPRHAQDPSPASVVRPDGNAVGDREFELATEQLLRGLKRACDDPGFDGELGLEAVVSEGKIAHFGVATEERRERADPEALRHQLTVLRDTFRDAGPVHALLCWAGDEERDRVDAVTVQDAKAWSAWPGPLTVIENRARLAYLEVRPGRYVVWKMTAESAGSGSPQEAMRLAIPGCRADLHDWTEEKVALFFTSRDDAAMRVTRLAKDALELLQRLPTDVIDPAANDTSDWWRWLFQLAWTAPAGSPLRARRLLKVGRAVVNWGDTDALRNLAEGGGVPSGWLESDARPGFFLSELKDAAVASAYGCDWLLRRLIDSSAGTKAPRYTRFRPPHEWRRCFVAKLGREIEDRTWRRWKKRDPRLAPFLSEESRGNDIAIRLDCPLLPDDYTDAQRY